MMSVKSEGEFKDGPTHTFLLPVSFIMRDNKVVGLALMDDGLKRVLVGEVRNDKQHDTWLRLE
jgi:hypothetical protein